MRVQTDFFTLSGLIFPIRMDRTLDYIGGVWLHLSERRSRVTLEDYVVGRE